MSTVLRLSDADQIGIAIEALSAGEPVSLHDVVASEPIPAGHKIALVPIKKGEEVRRLNQVIGRAQSEIAPGQWVHEHNLGYEASHVAHTIGSRLRNRPPVHHTDVPSFDGFLRENGKVGTRNFIGILSSVNCSSLVTRMIADHFKAPGRLDAYPSVDGVVALTHKSGCSVADHTMSMDMLRRTLGGYARNPNFAGVLFVGLGCEDNQIDALFADQGLEPGPMLRTLTIQDEGGTRSSIDRGIDAVEEMLALAGSYQRQKVPASELMVGLQCGGSDSFSGLSANPALGAAVDRLVGYGGTAILAETPEIHGAENLLLERAVTQDVGERLLGLLDWWNDYTKAEPNSFDDNASPGNRAGGLTTILEKSLGAVAKGGTSNLTDVIGFAQDVKTRGLVFMDSPGFDPVSATGQVASGANLIAFTTGRGSCFGCRPTPSMKLASNTPLFNRMRDDMDIDCGPVLDSTKSVEEMGTEIFEQMLRVASGHQTASEELGYGEDEFAPWHVNAWL